MMNNRIIGYILLIIGLVFLLKIDLLIGLNLDLIILIVMLAAGLLGTFTCIGNNKRVGLFIFSLIFLSSIFLFVTGKYVLLNQNQILLPAILFMIGAGLSMLFIDNPNEKVFLITAIFLIVMSMIFVFVLDGGIIIQANRITLYTIEFWPGLLILIGFLLLAGRYK